MPELTRPSPGDDVAATWGVQVTDRVVSRYATEAARDAAGPHDEGMVCYVLDLDEFQVYDGSIWETLQTAADLAAALLDYLPLAGGTMAGAINMNSNKLSNVEDLEFVTGDGTTFIHQVSGDPIVFRIGAVDQLTMGGGATPFSFRDDDDAEILAMLETAARFGGTTTGRPRIEFANGDPTRASYAFSGDSDSGMYRSAANTINFATAGVSRFLVGSSGTVVIQSGDFRISTDPTTGDAANANINASTGRVTRSTSAKKYKKLIKKLWRRRKDAEHLLDADLNPVEFTHKGNGKAYLGFIADELAELDPRLGEFNDDGEIENYDLRGVVAVLTAQVNELKARVAKLEA